MPKTNPNPSSRKFVFTLHNWTEIDWKYLPHLCETRGDLIFLKAAQESIPRTGKTILSADRCIIKEVKLEPEERARLDSKQEAALPEHLASSLARTREILEECEEAKQEAKRARFSQQ